MFPISDFGKNKAVQTDKDGVLCGVDPVMTTAPTAANPGALRFVVLEEEPQTKYDGYIYLIVESES